MKPAVSKLLDRLMGNWNQWEHLESEYLNVVLPGLVSGDPAQRSKETDKAALAQLRKVLSPPDWKRLPEPARARRAEKVTAEEEARAERARKDGEAEARRAAARREQNCPERKDIERRRAALLQRIATTLTSDSLATDALFSADSDAELVPRRGYESLMRIGRPEPLSWSRSWSSRKIRSA